MTLANRTLTSLEAVLDLAVWLEQRGQAFYEQARDQATDPARRELFAWLAIEEAAHGQTYRTLYTEVTGKPADQGPLLGEYGSYLNLLIGEIVATLQADATSGTDLVERALAFEKNTLLYFQEIRALFPGPGAVCIDTICTAERRHIVRLLELRNTPSVTLPPA